MNYLTEKLNSLAPTYCENQESWFLVEPLNTSTNISFLVIALLTYQLLRSRSKQHWKYKLLPPLILTIGVGSALWHTLHHPYTLLTDAIPIYITALLLLCMVVQKLASSTLITTSLTGLFILITTLSSIFTPSYFLNGSIRHAIAITTLALLLIWSYRKFGKSTHWLLATVILYALATLFRSIDIQSCPTTLVGTHFLWHLLAPISLYLIVRFLVTVESKE